ncbi:hypothetical protein SNE40_009567 [Patella caerulea]|uniref:Uncharacterized protein n=1 Tax=Patella caerulea TaxID=87958 RepID=A0AAN8JSV2_PATCE
MFPDTPIPTDELIKMQTTLDMSPNQTERLAFFMRTWKGRKVLEPGVMEKLRERDRELDEYYSTATLNMDSAFKDETGKVTRSVVYCNDLVGLVGHVMESRGVIGDHMIKIGIDCGGSFLKFCLNVVSCEGEGAGSLPSKRAKYQDGAFAKNFVDSGVKKLIIIAIVEHVKETYDNFTSVLELVELDKVDFVAAFDLKLANAFLGLGTHSSTCPCPWCELPKSEFGNHDRIINLRTLGAIRRNALEYQAAAVAHKGKRALSSAAFKSCEHTPLTKSLPDDVLVMDILPVMELHVMLGITNRLYNQVDQFESSRGTSIAKEWSDQLSLRRPHMHGGEFNGQQCVKLLENTSCLEQLMTENNLGEEGHRVIFALQSFNDVRKKCFGKVLHADYKESISAFEQSYINIGIPITSKCHAVFDHVGQFLETQKELYDQNQSRLPATERQSFNRGLGFWSEQASESVHSDFSQLWESGGYKRDMRHPEYDKKKLLKCVVTNCSRHT